MAGYAEGGYGQEDGAASIDVGYRCEEQRGDAGTEDGDVRAVGRGGDGDVEGLRNGDEGAVDDGLGKWSEEGEEGDLEEHPELQARRPIERVLRVV